MSEPDPIAEAFNNYRRPPKDVVPKAPRGDAPPMPCGFGIEVVSYEITDTGVTRETGNALVCEPIHRVEQLMQRRREREEDT